MTKSLASPAQNTSWALLCTVPTSSLDLVHESGQWPDPIGPAVHLTVFTNYIVCMSEMGWASRWTKETEAPCLQETESKCTVEGHGAVSILMGK